MQNSNIPITRPLQLLELLVLAVLTEGPSHGYGLVHQLDERMEGRMKLRPGNLYRILDRLSAAGLLEESDPPVETPGERKGAERTRGFAVTEEGRSRLDAETRFRTRALARTPAARAAMADGLRHEP